VKRIWLRGHIDLPDDVAEAAFSRNPNGYEVVCYVLDLRDGESLGDIDLSPCRSPYRKTAKSETKRRAE